MTDPSTERVFSSPAACKAGASGSVADSDALRLLPIMAYASPLVGVFFFYVPMWSILPGIYAKYFGLKLTAIAAAILFIRVFDGFADVMIGYLADRHRAAGGSRKPWVIAGSLGMVVPCYFLFVPSGNITAAYYMGWSLMFFLFYAIVDIPHSTWGSELTLDYQRRATVFGVRHIAVQVGTLALYAVPLLVVGASGGFTPEVLHYAVYAGAGVVISSAVWAWLGAPAGLQSLIPAGRDSLGLLTRSLIHNKPLLLYCGAYASVGLSVGTWYGLLFIYVDGYLGLQSHLAAIFILSNILTAGFTPLCLKLVQLTDKSAVWSMGIYVFCFQLLATLLIEPNSPWGYIAAMVVLGHLAFCCYNVAALSSLGDIIDYGKLKFRRDRGATYFSFNTLLFKVGVGVGGGGGLWIAGAFGFGPAEAVHSDASIFGLKLGFVGVPLLFSLLGLGFVWRLPINRRRHGIIRRRLELLAQRGRAAS
jgi:glycoside/pentoside/hexuronide:cation symporter, GPH family